MKPLLVFLGIMLAPAAALAYCEPPHAVGMADAAALERFARCLDLESLTLRLRIQELEQRVRALEGGLLQLQLVVIEKGSR